jgi:hypothetical protein
MRNERGEVENFTANRNEHVVGIVGVRLVVELLSVVDVLGRTLEARGWSAREGREWEGRKRAHNEVAEESDDEDGGTT